QSYRNGLQGVRYRAAASVGGGPGDVGRNASSRAADLVRQENSVEFGGAPAGCVCNGVIENKALPQDGNVLNRILDLRKGKFRLNAKQARASSGDLVNYPQSPL